MTASAIIVGAVFVAQLLSPSGMIAGIAGTELAALSANEPSAELVRRAPARSGPAWTGLFARLRDNLSTSPVFQDHVTVDRLLTLISEIELGRTNATAARDTARANVVQGPDNFLVRIAAAVIERLSASRAPEPRQPDSVLYAQARRIIEGASPARGSALYNREIDAAWAEILQDELRRPDVAAAAARYIQHYETTAHYGGLSVIQRHFAALADALEHAGMNAEAQQCRRWLAKLFIGLMQHEPDAGTRLLCADLLARTVDSAHPEAAAALRQLRTDFHAACVAAPIDPVDPARTHAVSGLRLRLSMVLFVFACASALAALGALSVFLFSPFARKVQRPDYSGQSPDRKGGIGPQDEGPAVLRMSEPSASTSGFFGNIKRLFHNSKKQPRRHRECRNTQSNETVVKRTRSLTVAAQKSTFAAPGNSVAAHLFRAAALPVGAFVICCTGIAWRIAESGVHSTTWAALLAVFLGTLGALVSLWSAGARRGAGVTAATTVVLFIVAAMIASPSRAAWIARSIDLVVPVVWIVLAACGGAVLLVSVASHATRRARLASSATTSLLCIVLAFTALQLHRAVDAKYLADVAAARADEVAARLGDDWQQRYLAPACRAYDIPLK